jgi:acetoin utilization protein AcuB
VDLRKLDRIPGVASVMTPFPFSVDVADPLTAAGALMERHGIRHVPVIEDGRIAGLVTDRDLALFADAALRSAGPPDVRVGQVCARDPYVVDLHTPIDRVVLAMAERQIEAAVVTREGKLAGIFTTSDACRILGELLAARFRGGGGEAA